MIAGLYLTEDSCYLAILDESLEIKEIETNREIVEALPLDLEVLAVNAPLKTGKELEEAEEELQEEGYMFTPGSHDETLHRRAMHLKQLLVEEGLEVELIRFDPMITSRELAIDGDEALKSYGLDTSGLTSAESFDSALGAITARFYQQDQFEDLGIVVPQPLQNT